MKHLKPNMVYKHFSFKTEQNVLRLSTYQQKFQHASRSQLKLAALTFAKLADILTFAPH
jgi:hypothetical protein